MNLTALRTELKARGFDYLSDSRLDLFLNDAYHAICDQAPWPFLETTTSGTAPLTISDLREVLHVVVTANLERLEQADSRDIVDMDPTTTQTGTPSRYWLDGLTTLKVWPANTSLSLSVRYLKVPTDLSSGSDTPLLPSRFHNLLIDFAAVRALKDASNRDEAREVQALADVDLVRMKDALLGRAGDDPDFIVTTYNYEQSGF